MSFAKHTQLVLKRVTGSKDVKEVFGPMPDGILGFGGPSFIDMGLLRLSGGRKF